MVKELDDAAGDELAVVLDARASCAVGDAAGHELRARGRRGGRARRACVGRCAPRAARARRRRRRARERDRAHGRAPAAGARSRRVASAPRRVLVSWLAARIEVVTSPPCGIRGRGARAPAGRDRDRPVGLRLLGAARRRRPGGAARGGLARGRAAAPRARSPCARPPCGHVAPRSCAGRCSRSPRSTGCSTCAISRFPRCPRRPCCRSSRWRRRPPSWQLRAGRRLGLVALAAALLVAAWVAAGHPPSPGSPLGGPRRGAARAPSAWVQVVLPFDRSHPELRAAVLIAAFRGWLRSPSSGSPVRGRSSPACSRCCRSQSARRSTTSRSIRGADSSPPGSCSRSCSRAVRQGAGRPRGGVAGARAAARRRLERRARGVAPGRAALDDVDVRGAGRRPAVALVWDMGYRPLSYPPRPVEVLRVRAPRPSYWRAVVLARSTAALQARATAAPPTRASATAAWACRARRAARRCARGSTSRRSSRRSSSRPASRCTR